MPAAFQPPVLDRPVLSSNANVDGTAAAHGRNTARTQPSVFSLNI